VTVTDDHDIGAPPPMPPNRPKRETPQERRTRLHLEANEWRQRIEDGSDPLTDAAMLARIKDAIRAAGGDPERWTEWDPTPPDPAADDANPLGPYLIDWREFWDAELDEQEWLLEPLFALRRSHALYAGAKTGKSYLVLAACAALATGRPFLLKPRSEPISVLYVDMEMTLEDLRDRLAEFGYGPDDDLSNLHYALLPSLPPLDTEAGGQALLAAALAVDAKFVIIDTTSRVIQGDENDADTMRAFYRHTGLLLKQHGIGWKRLDHSGKDGSKGQRGTSAKNDDVDVVIKLERTDKGQRITATHRRMSWFPEVTEILVADVDGTMTFTLPVSATGQGWPAGTREIADRLNELGLPVDVSARKASDALRASGKGHGYKKVQAAVKYRRQAAELAVEELVDNVPETALTGRERGSDADRAHDERAREGTERAHPPEPLQTKGSTALGTDERAQAHPEPDRARSRASHVVDAPAGHTGRDDVDDLLTDDDEDPFA
jgi:hypothetical protein